MTAAKRRLLTGAISAGMIVLSSPAVPQEGLVRGLLGLPEKDTRPPQRAFVLPSSDPSVSSEAAPALRAASNFYGMPGLIDMPAAHALPDGELQAIVSSFAGITRTTLTFQISPRLTGAFRYNRFADINLDGFEDYYDRAFDLHYQVLREDEDGWQPALAVGLRDFVGTGIEAGEYIVASKTFALPNEGRLRASAGLGWGRLGSYGDIGAPFGEDRPQFVPGDTGGEVDFGQWFRGPMAPFAGLEWQPGGRLQDLRVKVEYSSDAYDLEAGTQGQFERRSPLNFGVEYQANDTVRVGLYSLYGSEIGAMVTIAGNPRRSGTPVRLGGPGPVTQRPDRQAAPEQWTSAWLANPNAPKAILDLLTPALAEQNITVTGLSLPGTTSAANTAVVRVENGGYEAQSIVVGRTARTMAALLPPSVEVFRIVIENGGLPTGEVTVRRSDLERLDGTSNRSQALAAATTVGPAPVSDEGVIAPEGRYPNFQFSFGPYLSASLFDPTAPVRADVGLALTGNLELSRGLIIEGVIYQKLAGNVGDGRLPDTELEPVRTLGTLYADNDTPTIRRLTASYSAKLSPNVYSRASVGYFERMFGGVSGEVLWKPVDSRLALGAELAYVGQRDFDQRFGFQDYRVLTGHVSAYYEFGHGYRGQVDVGRYLAGDVGATLTLTREFANGWEVGAFATKTNVSAEEFGEGSFDKGIVLTIPMQSITGQVGAQKVSRQLRPVQRDGGARLIQEGRLYERVRAGHSEAIFADWSQVWR
ncbi:MAG: YjbH domain-containing protein [Rhodobacteraceae bacterium]|nr:YjbH domain-containing protein [Paracoccaceae bacterium]